MKWIYSTFSFGLKVCYNEIDLKRGSDKNE